MHKLTDYVLAIRSPGSPPAPAGVKTVDLMPGDVVESLRGTGLGAADFRSRVIFLAGAGPESLIWYAALCGFAGRRIDAYADGVVLEFSRLDKHGAAFADAGRPPGHLMWAQVGGPDVAGLPTVRLDPAQPGLVSPGAVTVIRYAARLRMVPPPSTRDALALFVLVAALRRRADDRFPYLSSGSEPVPGTKDDPAQGTDLEQVRRAALRYRQELRAGARSAEIVSAVPVGAHDQRIAEANAVDIATVLRRLGSSPDGDGGLWHCPRRHKHSNGDQRPSMKVHGGHKGRCHRCDAEKTGPVRLVVDVLDITPDEAATFILDSDRVVDMRVA